MHSRRPARWGSRRPANYLKSRYRRQPRRNTLGLHDKMTRSFEIRDSETLFEAAKALEEAIEGDESDTSVGDDASEIVFTGRPESIPVEATPVQSNPVPPVDKPALPTHGASGADVQIYIISAGGTIMVLVCTMRSRSPVNGVTEEARCSEIPSRPISSVYSARRTANFCSNL